MLKAETKPSRAKVSTPNSRAKYFMYAVVLCAPPLPSPRPEIEIVGFNLPNNDHKLHRGQEIYAPFAARGLEARGSRR